MKNFLRFFTEAQKSQAVIQATRLGLQSDGHGGWYDKKGEFVAKTEDGKLVFYNQGDQPGRDPNQDRTQNNQRPLATQTKKVSQPQQTQEPEKKTDDETEGKDLGALTIAFGRFNPPTVGHQKLFSKVASSAGGKEYRIYPSRSTDPKKNPLDPDSKISVMRKMYPDHGERIINDPQARTIFDVLKKADEEGYSSVSIVVGSDRVGEFEKLANDYNGRLYDFEEINIVSAGERDPDAEGVEGMSASKMRKAAMDDYFNMFRRGIPDALDDDSTKKLFNTLRKKMMVKSEGFAIWQIAPKLDFRSLRENYVKEKIFTLGQRVESLVTGLVGRIIRRGTNYLICVTEDEIMFKPWIKDIMEYQETEVSSIEREPGKPNTLLGTKGYFKYASKMTPGFDKGEETNLQKGAKAFKGVNGIDFINKYKKKKS